MTDKFIQILSRGILLFDGAMGTELQKRNLLDDGLPPEILNIDNFQAIVDIHKQYIEAGSKVITTNSFGGNRSKLEESKLSNRAEEVNCTAVKAAQTAISDSKAKDILIAASVGPTGRLMSPMGDMSWDEAVDIFKEQISYLAEDADIILLETFTDIHELRAAAFAAKEVTDIDVIASVALDDTGQLLTGGDSISLAVALEDLGVSALSLNCGLTPPQLLPFFNQLTTATDLPLLFQANCGLPQINSDNGADVYSSPDDFADQCLPILEAGINMIGGCCGSGPEHIKALSKLIEDKPHRSLRLNSYSNTLRIGGRGKTVNITGSAKVTIIGERINPTGRKIFAKELRANNLSRVKKDGLAQARKGADIIDVNVGTSGIVESELLMKAVEIAAQVNIPLSIDTSDVSAMEPALKACPGKALLNSASAETTRMEKVFELAAKYGAAVVCLPVDDNGLPDSVEHCLSILSSMIACAESKGVNRRNLILDGLVTTLGASSEAAKTTLKTIALIREKTGLPSILGVGNISHGLPGRSMLTSTFLAMAASNGLSAAIINPLKEEIYQRIFAVNALLGDIDSLDSFIDTAAKKAKETKKSIKSAETQLSTSNNFRCETVQPSASNRSSGENTKEATIYKSNATETTSSPKPGITNSPRLEWTQEIREALIDGLKEDTVKLVAAALSEDVKPEVLLEETLIPAMTEVGNLFSQKKLYLPGLLASAEAMEAGTTLVKEEIKRTGGFNSDKSDKQNIKVVIASVKGDIHDIGKNIVKLMLKNNGCEVFDLGKNVPLSTIIKRSIEIRPDIIALSALMTTTMTNMRDVAEAVKENRLSIPLIVGGAVVTEEFARSIGAAYAQDAAGAVKQVLRLTKGKM